MKTAISQLLLKDLEKIKERNPSYSLRSYARDLAIHPSLLLRYMRGDRNPRVQTLKKLLDRMGSDESIKLQVLQSAIQGTTFKIPRDEEYVEVTPESRERTNDWIYSAMLELFRSERRRFRVPDLAARFRIPNREVEARIRVLMEVGLLVKTQSGFKTRTARQSSRGAGARVAQIHRGYLEQVGFAMDEDRARDVSGTTVLISSSRLEEAKLRIRDFRRSLASFLAVRPGEREEALFRIQIALFSLEPERHR